MGDELSGRDIIDALLGEGAAAQLEANIVRDFEGRKANIPELKASSALPFMKSPRASDRFFARGGNRFNDNLKDTLEAVSIFGRQYVASHTDAARELSKFAPGFDILKNGRGSVVLGIDAICEEFEDNYLSNSCDIKELKNRMKLLAALDLVRNGDKLNLLLSSVEERYVAYPLFSYIRSMVQFLFFEYYSDGINMQINREKGAKKLKDRTGIKELCNMIMRSDKCVSQKGSVVWRTIKKYLQANGLTTFDNQYGVEFETDHNRTEPHSGHILQTDPDGKEFRMSYEAFKPFFRKLKKEGDS